MSHVDEGTIHAWLDGAYGSDDPERARIEEHLADCEACRRLVETERRVRDRASDVLAVASPDAVRVEPFERILAARRAREAATAAPGPAAGGDSDTGANPGPSRGPARFRMPMALAATLALALGATWFMRQYLPSAAPPADAALEAAADEDAADLPTAVVMPPPGAPALEPGRTATTEIRVQPGEQPSPATLARGSRAEAEVRDERTEVAAGSTSAAGAGAAEPPPGAAEQRARSPDETRRIAEAAMANLLGRAAATPMTFADADALTAVDRLDAPNEVSWTAAGMDSVAAHFGIAPLMLAGRTPDSIQVATIGRAPIARLVYRIDDQPIELVQWVSGSITPMQQALRQREADVEDARVSSGVEAKAVAPAAPSVYRIGGIDFVLRGPIPADSLAALVAAGMTGGG